MSRSKGQQLPSGWASATLADIVAPRREKAHPQKMPDALFIGMEQVEAHTMRLLGTVPCTEMRSSGNLFLPSDVLYGRLRSYLNKVYQPDFEGLCSGEFIVLPPSFAVYGQFLKYRLNSADFVRFASSLNTGDRPRVDFNQIKVFPLWLPPKNEQARIADTLDELFSDLDAGVAALERVQEKLKLYRASVLKAAVEGALTAEWCAKNPQAEPASELLKRILVERRRRWEEDQLAKFKSKGQEPPKNWKAKYKEPLIPDTANLNLLPKGWYWVTLDQAAWQLRSGTAETSGRDKTHYPVLKSSAVRHRIINFNDLNYLQKEQSSAENFLKQDDFLITRLSGSVDYVGCTAVVKDALCERIQYPDRIFCAKLVSLIEGTYLSYCFQNSQIRQVLQGAAKSTAGHKRISMSDLYPLVIPLPPEKEQKVIIEIVEGLLSVIDHLESELETKLKTSQSLRQSILHHAFTGRLVPQDPKDEPASELLKRIASEREARAKEVASAKRQPKVKSAKAGKGRRSKQQHQGER